MKLFLTPTCALVLTITGAFAQQPTPAQNPAPAQNSAHESAEISGCLTKTEGQFTIASTSGERLAVTGPGGLLDQHANHEVKITGTKMTQDGKSTFSASKVEMVAAACITKS
jgi:hypothetical protein